MSNRTMYQSFVGLLNYLSQCTRPDIAFATSYLARHLKEPRVAHLKKGKKYLAFLRDSQQKGLLFKPTRLQQATVEMYVDSSFGNGSKRRSIYGYVIMVNKSIVADKSKQMAMVTLSSTEAEFCAVALSIREIKWVMSILQETGCEVHLATIFSDNQGAIRIMKAEASSGRSTLISSYSFSNKPCYLETSR